MGLRWIALMLMLLLVLCGGNDIMKHRLEVFDSGVLPTQRIVGHFIGLLKFFNDLFELPTRRFELGKVIAPPCSKGKLRPAIAFTPFLCRFVQRFPSCLALLWRIRWRLRLSGLGG